MTKSKFALAAVMTSATLALASPGATAAPLTGARVAPAAQPSNSMVEQIQWRRGGWRGGRGIGIGAGILGGAILGSALAAPYYYRSYSYYPRSYYYDDGYGYGGGDAVAYCASRFRSYDPASGTYLGYDGFRHPCP